MATPNFEIHTNRELGNKKFYSKKEYYAAMKSAGLSPYNPADVKKNEPKSYERSKWANDMYQDIKNRKGAKPGDRFIQELAKRGYTQEAADKARRAANSG